MEPSEDTLQLSRWGARADRPESLFRAHPLRACAAVRRECGGLSRIVHAYYAAPRSAHSARTPSGLALTPRVHSHAGRSTLLVALVASPGFARRRGRRVHWHLAAVRADPGGRSMRGLPSHPFAGDRGLHVDHESGDHSAGLLRHLPVRRVAVGFGSASLGGQRRRMDGSIRCYRAAAAHRNTDRCALVDTGDVRRRESPLARPFAQATPRHHARLAPP